MFRPVPTEADFAKLETEELARWGDHRVFERSIELRAGADPWVFYEGPPTANGRPGLHHVWARVYKDLFCRYRTMRGYAVPRKAGWDTHGLPVEVEVEKQLGITNKRQIEEEVGIEEFVRLCRESVRNYVGDWKRLTERIGYWIDIDDAYWTFSPDYIESVWWELKELWNQGLLFEDIKVVPYCPRCGTPLSSHELGQPDVYRDVVDESAFVLFPLLDEGDAAARLAGRLGRDTVEGLSLVVWTTTPWTLLSNTGAAVGPDLDYSVVDGMIVASDLVESVFGENARKRATITGADLVGLRYRRPFDDLAVTPGTGDGWRVVPGNSSRPTRAPGSSIWLPHSARPTVRSVGSRDCPPSTQWGPTAASPMTSPGSPGSRCVMPTPRSTTDWKPPACCSGAGPTSTPTRTAGGVAPPSSTGASRAGTSRPRSGKPSWWPRTRPSAGIPSTSATAGWGSGWPTTSTGPSHRDRYWGTPLPVWRCGNGHVVCVGSLSELSELAGRDVSEVDPHRPAIDEVTFSCPTCADDAEGALSEMRRVEPVIDAWFDSGSMPAGQWGYPLAPVRRSASSTRRTSSARPSTRPAVGSTRFWP